jgi:ureidoacrylate peracid hydrolase
MSLLEHVKPGISRRVDFALRQSKSALLIVDIQKYLTYPEHDYFHQTSLPRALQNIEKLAHQFRSVRDSPSTAAGCEVIFVYLQSTTNDCRDISLDYKLSGPMLANMPRVGDAEIFLQDCQPDRLTGKGDILLPKTSCSVFQSTNLHYLLRNLGIEQLVVTGQLTDECVESTVRDGADLGYLMTVAEDACAALSLERHKAGLLGMHGFSRILKTAHIIWEIAESVEAQSSENLSLEVLTTFLKERGFADAAIEVASFFSNRNRRAPTRPIAAAGISDQHANETGSKRSDNEDIVTVSSAVADNIRQQTKPGSQSRLISHNSEESPTKSDPVDDEHLATTPTKTNVMLPRVAARGRDPSVLAPPDLSLESIQPATSLSTAQYKRRNSAASIPASPKKEELVAPKKEELVGRSRSMRSTAVDVDEIQDQLEKNRDPPAVKHVSNQIEL